MARGRMRLHLVDVQVHLAAGGEDQAGAEIPDRLPVSLGAPVTPPHCQHVPRRLVVLQAEVRLVPGDGPLAQPGQEPVHLVDDVALQARGRVDAELLLELLRALPVVDVVPELVRLVPAEVEVAAGEQTRHLLDGAQDVRHGLLRGQDDAVGAAHAVRWGGQLVDVLLFGTALVELYSAEVYLLAAGGDDEGGGVGRDVDLGDDLDRQRRGKRHELLHLLPGEEARLRVGSSFVDLLTVLVALFPVDGGAPPAANQGQLWPAGHLDAPALVIGQVDVQHVELVHRHQEQQPLHPVQIEEVPCNVQHQTSPAVARPVAYPATRDTQRQQPARGAAEGCRRQQLPQGLQRVDQGRPRRLGREADGQDARWSVRDL
mmetsp:Transcript_116620/g.363169  ORF Transcript_116620/g.363169 Transcript_116620/m.363169 type:complete len:373 (+) Transcript_116620:388-1506(+)